MRPDAVREGPPRGVRAPSGRCSPGMKTPVPPGSGADAARSSASSGKLLSVKGTPPLCASGPPGRRSDCESAASDGGEPCSGGGVNWCLRYARLRGVRACGGVRGVTGGCSSRGVVVPKAARDGDGDAVTAAEAAAAGSGEPAPPPPPPPPPSDYYYSYAGDYSYQVEGTAYSFVNDPSPDSAADYSADYFDYMPRPAEVSADVDVSVDLQTGGAGSVDGAAMAERAEGAAATTAAVTGDDSGGAPLAGSADAVASEAPARR